MSRLACLMSIVAAAKPAGAPTRPTEIHMTYANPFVGTGADGHTFPGSTYPFGMVQLSPTSDVWDWSHCSGYHYDDKSMRCFSHINLSGTGWTDTGDVGVFPIRANMANVSVGEEDPTFPAIPGMIADCTDDSGSWRCASACDAKAQPASAFSKVKKLMASGMNDTMAEHVWATNSTNLGAGTVMCQGWRSSFSHEAEEAWPGYYGVDLATHNVYAELTALERTGIHRYTFQPRAEDSPLVVLDLTNRLFPHANIVTATQMRWISDTEIGGYAHCGYNCWRYNYLNPHLPKEGKTHFYIKFSQPMKKFYATPTDRTRFEYQIDMLDFSTEKEVTSLCPYGGDARCRTFFVQFEDTVEELLLHVGISHTSIENAKLNLEHDVKVFDFDTQYKQSTKVWSDSLGKLSVKSPDENRLEVFYSGFYHTHIHPNLTTDVSRDFVSFDKVYKTGDIAAKMGISDFDNYSTFSTWDTFRGLHPLHSFLEPEKTAHWVNSIVSRYHTGNYIALWELMGGDTITQIGYPSVPVVVNALLRGVNNVNEDAVFEAVSHIAHFNVNSSSDGDGALDSYLSRGYVAGETPKSVSKTLEYAFEDYCIAELAKKMKRPEEDYYRQRSMNYRNLWNADKKQFWPKDKDGVFLGDFNVHDWDELNKHWIAGNMWGYNYFVAQDMSGLIELHGGEKAFEADLDNFFTQNPDMEGDHHVDISGWIGSYAHGEESSHSNAYLYNFVYNGEKSQSLIRKVLDKFYLPQPAGLINNEDCGQMSAWMIWASLGLYPFDSCSNTFTVGAPFFDEISIKMGNGNVLNMKTEALSGTRVADDKVVGVTLNGVKLHPLFVEWEHLREGGELVYQMSPDYVKPDHLPGDETSSDLTWVWVIVAAAVLILIAGGVVFCSKRNKQKKDLLAQALDVPSQSIATSDD
ncbi:MAG: hypothetical protein KVP17_000339 [Porospora cf. gigantea B]|uniref:uncharacterized protein n=2 Tax=Porospora cf. gigantea B TaxID=2853592 RepID=UPI003571D0AE|nr:MAG: hypothetical protein KVP17_000339 [Porospora cf. gigantea B]